MLAHWCLSRNFDHKGYWAPGQLYAASQIRNSNQFTLLIVNRQKMVVASEVEFPEATQLLLDVFRKYLVALGMPLNWVKRAEVTFSFNVKYEHTMHLWRSGLGGQPALCCVTITSDLDRIFTKVRGCNVWIHNPAREQRRAL